MQPFPSAALYPMALSTIEKMYASIPENSLVSKFTFALDATITKCQRNAKASILNTPQQMTTQVSANYKKCHDLTSPYISLDMDKSKRIQSVINLLMTSDLIANEAAPDELKAELKDKFDEILKSAPDYTSHPLFPFLEDAYEKVIEQYRLKNKITNCFYKYVLEGFGTIAKKMNREDTFAIEGIRLEVSYITPDGRSQGSLEISNVSDIIYSRSKL